MGIVGDYGQLWVEIWSKFGSKFSKKKKIEKNHTFDRKFWKKKFLLQLWKNL